MKFAPCELCGRGDFYYLMPAIKYSDGQRFLHPNINISICKNCGLIFTNPIQNDRSYSSSYYYIETNRNEDKTEYCKAHDQSTQIPNARAALNKLQDYIDFTRLKAVLDIGTSGAFLSQLSKIEPDCRLFGVESDPYMAVYGRNEYNIPDYINIRIEDAYFEKRYFDLICMQNAIYMLSEPSLVLSKLRENLKNDGFLYISLTNYFIPRAGYFKNKGHYINVDDLFNSVELFFYSDTTLIALLEKNGFEPVETFTIPIETGSIEGMRIIGFLFKKTLEHTKPNTHEEGMPYEKICDEILNFCKVKTRSDVAKLIDHEKINSCGIWGDSEFGHYLKDVILSLGVDFGGFFGFEPEGKKKGMTELISSKPDAVFISSYSHQDEIYQSIKWIKQYDIKVFKGFVQNSDDTPHLYIDNVHGERILLKSFVPYLKQMESL